MALAQGAAAQGLIFESDEAYATYPKLERHRGFLPERVDLSPHFPTPGDQGEQGSCVGWAVGYAARSYYAVTREGQPRNQASAIPSPSYIYGAIKPPGSCDTGAQITPALALLAADGSLSLARHPYNDRLCPVPNRVPISQFRIASWRAIKQGVLDDVKGALAKEHPVIVGSGVTRAFMRLRGEVVWRGEGERVPGGHAMTLVGYDERLQAFKVINSWGTRWGNGGFGWIGYEAYRAFVRQAFVMDVAVAPRPPLPPRPPGPQPAPQPAPAPLVTLDPPLASYQCASLEVVREGGANRVRGFVGTQADLAKLTESARRAGLGVGVAVRPWPQCETLLTFNEVFAAAGAPRLRLRGDKRVYKKGDPLVIEVTTPTEPSHLYVVYIPVSGEVVYLEQPAGLAPQPQSRTIVLGDGSNGGPRFTIDRPFGEEMILAIASASPLFDRPRPPEIERDFLTAFRKALLVRPSADAAKRKVSGAWIVLTTKED